MKTIKSVNSSAVKTELNISNLQFKEALEARIEIGEDMLKRVINSRSEIELLIKDSNSWADYNKEYLKQSFNNPNNEYKRDYISSCTYWGGLVGPSHPQPEQERIVIKNQITNLENLVTKSILFKSSAPEIIVANDIKNTSQVFIVHGHDETAEIKTARFIERLGLTPIILHEQSSGGKTIIEKIERYSNVGFGIVLYTSCDVGGKNDSDLKARARQNVVFEHGYLIGKIGRENVCALIKGDIELPNDISGVVYVSMDESNAWHFKIAKELINAGYKVDVNKLI